MGSIRHRLSAIAQSCATWQHEARGLRPSLPFRTHLIPLPLGPAATRRPLFYSRSVAATGGRS